jgi:hypothetical protein
MLLDLTRNPFYRLLIDNASSENLHTGPLPLDITIWTSLDTDSTFSKVFIAFISEMKPFNKP